MTAPVVEAAPGVDEGVVVERELTPEEKLEALEEEAVLYGIPEEKLVSFRAIGNCPRQIQMRIEYLECWLAENT